MRTWTKMVRSAPSGQSDGASQGLALADSELAELLIDTQDSGETQTWASLWMLGQQVSYKYCRRHQTPKESTSLTVTRSRRKVREGSRLECR